MLTAPRHADAPGPEDLKIIGVARAARARARTTEGAAVRDSDGRTYAATTVELPSLRLSALQLAVAMAVSSGISSLEAAAVVAADHGDAPTDLEVVRQFAGTGVPVFLANDSGDVVAVVTT